MPLDENVRHFKVVVLLFFSHRSILFGRPGIKAAAQEKCSKITLSQETRRKQKKMWHLYTWAIISDNSFVKRYCEVAQSPPSPRTPNIDRQKQRKPSTTRKGNICFYWKVEGDAYCCWQIIWFRWLRLGDEWKGESGRERETERWRQMIEESDKRWKSCEDVVPCRYFYKWKPAADAILIKSLPYTEYAPLTTAPCWWPLWQAPK